MKTRLYNEFGAAYGEHVKFIDDKMYQALKEINDYALSNNLDLRDVQNIINSCVSSEWASYVLTEAYRMHKALDKTGKLL